MGVIRNKNRSRSDSQQLEFNSELADLFLDSIDIGTTDEEETSHLLLELEASDIEARREGRKQKKAASRNNVRRSRPEAMFRGLGCRGKGRKRFQRYENGNLLAQSIAHTFGGLEMDDMIEDINIHDFVPRSVSAFAQLLMEKENMMAWNDFITSSEEVQNDFLKRNPPRRVKNSSLSFDEDESGSEEESDSEEECGSEDESKDTDCRRSGHPAFSPELCFQRIDSRLRQLLRRGHVPMGTLENMEEEVTSFFESSPKGSVYENCLPSSFQRMLLHATAQYLDLKSKSYDYEGTRWSKVMNRNSTFARPTIKLANYLETSVRSSPANEHPSKWSNSGRN